MREATSAEHELTELAFEKFDLANPADYTAFLTVHRAALAELEPGLQHAGWSEWKPRLPMAADDLLTLSGEIHVSPCSADRQYDDAAAWGVQYVLEGSRLGGQILCQRIPTGSPRSYLASTPETGRNWRAFCDALDEQAQQHPTAWLDRALTGAKSAFRTFQTLAHKSESSE
ncbi:heme oxygenase [Altererythrobacter luteolus]|uniref:Heme oxygenase n=1 Tax=Pontixanthobacter luteolus TaxID=295089 RepID=A0A6I4V2K1_9SPHN|nr:biliverdin-producing heme oxygenase [Pontixanthobacter luteolus]MXP48153.1 heme oxygenase [Pontixanthobacter luteolus]